jgi:hypothetical protein
VKIIQAESQRTIKYKKTISFQTIRRENGL